MICELCNEDTTKITACNQEKNGYCGLYRKQAEKDGKVFGKKNYKTLAELELGDVFRYKGSDENDWHTVNSVDSEKIHYTCGNVPQSNWRTDNVEVIVK